MFKFTAKKWDIVFASIVSCDVQKLICGMEDIGYMGKREPMKVEVDRRRVKTKMYVWSSRVSKFHVNPVNIQSAGSTR